MSEVRTRERYTPGMAWNSRCLRYKLAFLIGVTWTLYILCSMFNLFYYVNVVVFPMTHNVICAGAIITLALLTLPRRKKKSSGQVSLFDDVLDTVLILFCIVGTAYVGINAEALAFSWQDASPLEMVLGIGVGVAALEASRRCAGWAPVILVLISFFYFVYSDHFPGFLMSSGYSYPSAVSWMYLSGEGMWGATLGTVATMVPGFILFGALLRATGGSEFFGDIALACLGRFRGGPAKTAVLSSMLFGSISGAPAANVATTGQITIPMMKQNGFSPAMAGAVEAVASTGGCFTPPVMGSVAFIMADVLGIGYWSVCIACFLPALVYYGILLFQIDSEAIRLNLVGLPKESLPKAGQVLRKGWMHVVPLLVLIFCLGELKYSAQTSILYTVIAQVLCISLNKSTRLSLRGYLTAFEDTAAGMVSVFPICTIIGILVGVLTISGTGAGLAGALTNLAGNNQALLLLFTAITIFFMGMGMTMLACYLLAVAMVVPALVSAGIPPLTAHMFLLYYGTLSFITPPVAIAAFVGASIADADPTATGLHATRLGLSAFLLPCFFVTNPGILWEGGMDRILFDFVGTVSSLMLLSGALTGVMFRVITKMERLLAGALGCLFVVPFPDVYNLVIVPVCAAAVIVFWMRGRRLGRTAVSS